MLEEQSYFFLVNNAFLFLVLSIVEIWYGIVLKCLRTCLIISVKPIGNCHISEGVVCFKRSDKVFITEKGKVSKA